jgi:HlyD family type I secretion membrane fusion protein
MPFPIPHTHIEIERERAKADRWLVWSMAVAVLGFVFYSSVAPVEVAVVAQGRTTSEGRTHAIGSFDGGTVAVVHARQHGRVSAGDPMIELDPDIASADSRQMRQNEEQARADVIRLSAERDGTTPDFSDIQPEIAASAMARFESRRMRRMQEIRAKTSELDSKERLVLGTRRAILPLKEEIEAHAFLVEKGNFARTRLLEELSRMEEMKGRLSSGEADAKNVRSQIESLRAGHGEETAAELNDAQARLAEASQMLAKSLAHQGRTIVRAPVSGRVKTISVHGSGAPVKPGDVLAEIVPDGQRMIVEARIQSSDVGHVFVGQRVQMTLSPPDMAYEPIFGAVISIAPDARADEKGNYAHYVEILPEATMFPSVHLDPYRLSPGVPVLVSAAYGQRTLFQYLFGGLIGEFQIGFKSNK